MLLSFSLSALTLPLWLGGILDELFFFRDLCRADAKSYTETAIFITIRSHIVINVGHTAPFGCSSPTSTTQYMAEIEMCPLKRLARMDGLAILFVFLGI